MSAPFAKEDVYNIQLTQSQQNCKGMDRINAFDKRLGNLYRAETFGTVVHIYANPQGSCDVSQSSFSQSKLYHLYYVP